MKRKRKEKNIHFRLWQGLRSILLFLAGMVFGILSFILTYQASPSGKPAKYIYENF